MEASADILKCSYLNLEFRPGNTSWSPISFGKRCKFRLWSFTLSSIIKGNSFLIPNFISANFNLTVEPLSFYISMIWLG